MLRRRYAWGPPLEQVVADFETQGFPLPEVGQAVLVLYVNRSHGINPERPDPWDDAIGILQRLPDGWLDWWACQGSAEPGWKPMYRQGNIATHAEGCARLVCPQYAPDAYGGGFHHWRSDRPAFRQVGKAHVERFSIETELWSSWGDAVISANCHTISPLLDWRIPWKSGVGDWSHACPVVLHQKQHAHLLERGGWTPEVDGVRLALAVLPWPRGTRLLRLFRLRRRAA